ncbi:MAG: phytanoyl-CoA dioxygenase family protein [Planctomycetota bacterium]
MPTPTTAPTTTSPSLSAEQIEQFKTEGYTVLEGLFDEREVAAMQAEVQRFQDTGLIHNVKTQGDGSTHSTGKVNLQLCPMSPHSELFIALPFLDKVRLNVASLIGDDTILHLDQVFLKPGLRGTGTNWHQDNAYFQIDDPMQGTAMWIAVHDAHVANGTMRILPGMAHAKLEHSRDPDSDHHIRCYPDNELDSVAFDLPAGSVGFFAYGIPHCTMGNNTTKDRAGCAYHFLTYEASRTGARADEFGDDRDNKPALTGPQATFGQAEYGRDMRGAWDTAVQAALEDAPAATA